MDGAGVEVAALVGAVIVEAAVAKGVDAASLCQETHFDPAVAHDLDARIPFSVEQALWMAAARLSGDPAFGVHAAERVRPGVFGVFDYAVRTAPTLGASFDRLSRYNRLVHDAAVITVLRQGGTVRVEHALRDPTLVQVRHAAEFTLAAIAVVARQITGGPVVFRVAELRHERPESHVVAEIERVVGVAPRFGCRCNALETDAETLDRPSATADASLLRVIERHAEMLLAERPDDGGPTGSVAGRVRSVLSARLAQGDASLAVVATHLGTTERALQRRLAHEGVTFESVLDDLRHDLARRYLADKGISVAEIAYLLGYADPSPFYRAFRRWTGTTPREARRA
jgi:AraC-like DNA-binding protein